MCYNVTYKEQIGRDNMPKCYLGRGVIKIAERSEDITKDNYKYYKRLLAIQKSDASAYEEKYAEKMYNELSIKEEKIRTLF